MPTRREFLLTTAGAGASLFLVNSCSDQGSSGSNFPQRPITLVVGSAAGGSTDQTARALTANFQLDADISVQNREGGNQTIALAEVANEDPDGYTLILASNGPFSTEMTLREVQYTIDDFVAITGVIQEPQAIAVRADSPWESLDDLLQVGASEQPLRAGQSGSGSWLRLVHDALYNRGGVDANNVPFDGSAPAIQGLLGDEIDSVVASLAELKQYVDSGDARYLGIFSEERSDLDPDVPTVQEQGYDVPAVTVTKSILAPAGVPDDVVQALRDGFADTFDTDDYQAFIDENLLEPREIGGDEVIDGLKSDQEKAQTLIEELDVDVDG
ncbi:tripartite tricarboxylate transporter substrate binding protein [Phytoactinopolyspora halophila]|nr:tripartite tricarboxylate transporter substrate binding protein [Phytoactinopolyspora halophila]